MNTDNTIKVTINGLSAKGKTVIGLVLKEALENYGVDVKFGEDQHEMKQRGVQQYLDNLPEIFENIRKQKEGYMVEIIEESRVYDKPLYDEKKLKRISKYISYLLRHEPKKENLNMDRSGYVYCDNLRVALGITEGELDWIVENNNKKRFEYNLNRRMIRATQGHSFEIDHGYEPITPPNLLYHGTNIDIIDSVLNKGLLKMSRQHVHLTDDPDTAKQVGMRHAKNNNKLWVIEIHTERMHEDGYNFFKTSNGVYLTDHVPAEYITTF